MRTWNGWTKEERMASLKKTKAAIARGEIPAVPARCCECGQEEGIKQWHNTDYSHPTKFLKGLCWRCHMMLHSKHFAKEKVEAYFNEIKEGVKYPPVWRHDFGILAREHGVIKPW